MNDAVDRLILERAAMDRGFPGSVLVSIAAHLLLVGFAFAAPLLFPGEPPIKVQDGFAVALPRGGGGTPDPQPPAPTPAQPQPAPPEPPKEQPKPPKVLKPPKEEPKRGLPEPDAKKAKGKKPPKEEPRPARGGAPGGRGTSAQTPGFEFGPPGPGVPEGTDPFGDWYLASVQQKIWMLWNQQIKSGMTQPAVVSFTIQADGNVTDVRLVQSSGVSLLDMAAQRAIYSAAPFGPLPKDYATNRIAIQGIFKPTS